MIDKSRKGSHASGGLLRRAMDVDSEILRIGNGMTFTDNIQKRASGIASEFEQKKPDSRISSTSLAAAALYVVHLEPRQYTTQREIAEVAGISEVTLRTVSHSLIEELHLQILTPDGPQKQYLRSIGRPVA